MQILAARLKEARESKGLSQKKAAEALYISNTSLSNYELNISTPSPETLAAMAEFYDVTLDYLFGINDRKYTEKQSTENLRSPLPEGYDRLNLKNKKLVNALIAALIEKQKK